MDGRVTATRGGGKARGARLALPLVLCQIPMRYKSKHSAMDVKRLRRMDLKPSAVPSSALLLFSNIWLRPRHAALGQSVAFLKAPVLDLEL